MAHAAPQLTLEIEAEAETATDILNTVVEHLPDGTQFTILNMPVGEQDAQRIETEAVSVPTESVDDLPDDAFRFPETFDACSVKGTDVHLKWQGSTDYDGVWDGLGWSLTYSPYNRAAMNEVDENKQVLDAFAAAADNADINHSYYMNVRTV